MQSMPIAVVERGDLQQKKGNQRLKLGQNLQIRNANNRLKPLVTKKMPRKRFQAATASEHLPNFVGNVAHESLLVSDFPL